MRVAGLVCTIPRAHWAGNGCVRYRLADRAARAHAYAAGVGLRPARALGRIDADAAIALRPVDPRDDLRAFRGLRVADYDDLLFAEPLASPALLGGGRSRDDARRRTLLARRALRSFERVIVSTRALAEAVADAHPRAEVVVAANDLDPRWIAQGRALYRSWRPGDARIIRYLPGSTHREADFAVAAPALAAFLERYGDTTLEVVGELELERWRFPAGRTRRLPPVAFDDLAGCYASAWVTLAPLALNAFSRCKSAIKFTEAAAHGAPCVATASPAMLDHGGDGVLLADGTDAWLDRLESLRDDDARLALGDRLRRFADAHAAAGAGAGAFFAALRRWSGAR